MLVQYLLLQLIAIQTVFSEQKIRGKENNVAFINFVHHENFQLSGTPLKKVALKTSFGCLWECYGESRCVSLNVNTKSDSQGLFECALLGFDKYEYMENFTAVNGIDHHTLPIDYLPDHENCAVISKTDKNADSGVFRIKTSPSRSVHAYCDMVTSDGGWTVIQKRLDGSVDFYRGWADYKKGFGNKSGEYWLGLDAIHNMTSQGKYRLRVDLEDFEGNVKYAEYESFVVAGESDNYKLTLGNYSGDVGDSLTWHNNMQFTTKDRDNDLDGALNCAHNFTGAWWYKHCHNSNLNGLYLKGTTDQYGKGVVWWAFKGHYYSLKRSEMKIRPIDYFHDMCENCAVISKTEKNTDSGVFRIKTSPSRSVRAYCDMVTSGGGWTVIQKRLDGSVNFYRGWADYKKGFGSKTGEYWLGLDAIHIMTSQGNYRLRVDLEDFEGNVTYAEYESFIVAGESENYKLTLGNYSGNAGDSLTYHNNMQFTTKDRDSDLNNAENCAQRFTGGTTNVTEVT